MKNNPLIIEHASPFDVETTVTKLIAAATAQNWQNPAVHNLQQSLANAGKAVRPVQVIEICKPEYSGAMLEKNHERIVSVMMPCRISVYQKEDGKAYIALLNMESEMPATAVDAIRAANNESFAIVKSVVEGQ